MQFESLKKWLPLALVAVPLLWLGAYAWAWMTREGCPTLPIGACWVTAAGNWLADVVMFKWMDSPLAAGFLAFAGGTFVYFAARQQRREQLSDRYQATRELRLGHLSEIRRHLAALNTIGFNMTRGGPYLGYSPDVSKLNTVRDTLQALDVAVANTGPFAPTLAHVISNQRNAIQSAVDASSNVSDPSVWSSLKTALRYAGTAAGYFTPLDRLINAEGHFVHQPKSTDRDKDDLPNSLHWLFDFN